MNRTKVAVFLTPITASDGSLRQLQTTNEKKKASVKEKKRVKKAFSVVTPRLRASLKLKGLNTRTRKLTRKKVTENSKNDREP